jgi:hypothetical protein
MSLFWIYYSMSKEYITLQFPNTSQGQAGKINSLKEYGAQGWTVASETITPGKFRGGNACCLALLCLPLAFLAGSTDGVINLTLEREHQSPI